MGAFALKSSLKRAGMALLTCACLGAIAAPGLTQDALDALLEEDPLAQPIPLFLEVFINGVSTELIAEFQQDPETGGMSSPRSELNELGIRVPMLQRGLVSLDALDGLAYVYDEAAQTLQITAETDALLPKVVSASRRPAPLEPDKTTGLVINYDAVAGFGSGADSEGLRFDRASLALDGWVFSPIGHLSNSGILSSTAVGDSSYLRLGTTYEFNAPGTAVTFAAGDLISSSLSWGRAVRMGGVQVRREFNLRSDLVTEPLLSFSGAAAVPSTVDVFVENNRVYSGRTGQGPYRFEDIPIYDGYGDAVVVIRDENGNVTKREVAFFSSRNLLKQGILDYSVEVGRARDGYGQTSWEYGDDTLYSASLRYGLTNRLTLQGHVEGKSDLTMLGFGASFVVANRAEMTLAAGHSDYSGSQGQFAYGALRTTLFGAAIEASMLRASSGFTDLAYATGADFVGAGSLTADRSLLEFPTAQDVVSLSVPVGRDGVSLGFSYVRSERAASRDEIVSVSYGQNFEKRNISFNVTGAHDLETDNTRFSAFLTMPTGKRTFSQASASVDGDSGSRQGLSLVRALGDAEGDYGYQAQLDLGDDSPAWQVAASIRSRAGRGEAALRRTGGAVSGHARFDGALVFMGGKLAAGNQVRDGFAIVDAGARDVPVYLQNREVARTGRSGRALVPGLSSYGQNRISINVDELPEGVSYNATAMDVIPARRSGALVEFGGVSASDSALVILRDTSGDYLPVGSEVVLDGESFVVGYDGAAFIKGLGPRNTVKVRTKSGTCTARFAFTAAEGPQTVIDPVVCK